MNKAPLIKGLATARHKNLVFTSAGENANLKQWLNGPRQFDLCVVYYGDSTGQHAELADYYLENKGGKFPNLHFLYKNYPEIACRYDAILVMDDDIQIDAVAINELFAIRDRYDLWILQPAFNPAGKISHAITKQASGSLLRYTNFVEVTCPLFRRDKLDDFMKVYDPILIGWGVDWWFIKKLAENEKDRVAIVDAVTCTNPLDRDKTSGREINRLQTSAERKFVWECEKVKYSIDNEESGYVVFSRIDDQGNCINRPEIYFAWNQYWWRLVERVRDLRRQSSISSRLNEDFVYFDTHSDGNTKQSVSYVKDGSIEWRMFDPEIDVLMLLINQQMLRPCKVIVKRTLTMADLDGLAAWSKSNNAFEHYCSKLKLLRSLGGKVEIRLNSKNVMEDTQEPENICFYISKLARAASTFYVNAKGGY